MHNCANCKKKHTTKPPHCQQCQRVAYCDRECQKKDWAKHKLICKPASLPQADKYADLNEMERVELLRRYKELLGSKKIKAVITIEDVPGRIECLATLKQTYREIEGKPHTKSAREELTDQMNHFGSKEPLPIVHNDLTVAPSSRHGNGVFATKSIPAGVVVTFYPCEAIHDTATGIVTLYQFGDELDLSLEKDKSVFDDYKFGFRLADNLAIIGNPRRSFDPRLLAHLINDGATEVFHQLATKITSSKNKKELLRRLTYKHDDETSTARNCIYRSDATKTVLSVVTTRTIEAGEELFISYGIRYWLEHQLGFDYKEKHPFIDQFYTSLGL